MTKSTSPALDTTAATGAVEASNVGNRRDFLTGAPIKRVVVIVSENQTFDHVATYKPTNGQRVDDSSL